MKKLIFLATFFIAMIVLSGFVSAQTSTDVSSAASAKAEESRKKAADFESAAYFPSEWEAAEAQYADAAAQKTQAAYNAAADAFDAVFMLAIPLYAQAREDDIMVLRKNLVSGGVRDYFPEEFTQADKTAVSARDQFKARDYYMARDTAAKALMMYQCMTSIYNAWLVRHEIEQREFQSYDQDNFNSAGEIFGKTVEAYKQNDLAAARENADEALKRYNLILSTAWAVYAELCSSKTKAERQAALDIKTNIATKDLFNEADLIYKAAEDTYTAKKYEEAAYQYITSEALFITANELTTEKRNRAAGLVIQAIEKIEKSAEIANQGKITIKGGGE